MPEINVRASDPAAEVARVLAQREHRELPHHVCAEIASAVLACASGVLSQSHRAYREQWEADPRYQDYVRQNLRHALLEACASQGMVPTQLPVEELRYFEEDGPFGISTKPISPEVMEKGFDAWGSVEIVLSVPVRRPEIDRAAAMRAGLLRG